MPYRPSFFPLGPDCFTTRLHLHEYVDEELETSPATVAVRHLVAGHLQECPRCECLARQLRAQRESLRRYAQRTAERASDQLRDRVRHLLAG